MIDALEKYKVHELNFKESERGRIDRLLAILRERRRQVNVREYTADKDDNYVNQELGYAAACYAFPDITPERSTGVPFRWPWSKKKYKKSKYDRRRQLIVAAALCLAELERIDRGVDLELLGKSDGVLTTPHVKRVAK